MEVILLLLFFFYITATIFLSENPKITDQTLKVPLHTLHLIYAQMLISLK